MGGWTYMLRCADGSFYAGSTSYDEVHIRVAEHNEGRYSGYTSARRPVNLVWSKCFDDLRDAHAMERWLKGWSRAKKLALVRDDSEALRQLSKRRAGKPKSLLKPAKRQLVEQFHALGRRHPEVAAKRPTKDDAT